MPSPLPWQEQQWQRLRRWYSEGRVPHALLLRGPKGYGKYTFAMEAAMALVCEDERTHPCGECRGCRLASVATHPDILSVLPLEGKKSIGIDQIRDVIAHVWVTRQYAQYKIVLLKPAETMTLAAANSLLKTLEEPPEGTVFLLVSHYSTLLPITIRSRCQNLDFPTPPADLATAWLAPQLSSDQDPALLLQLAQGAPITARDLYQTGGLQEIITVGEELLALYQRRADPLSVAERWQSLGIGRVLPWLISFTITLLRRRWESAPQRNSKYLTATVQDMDQTHLYRVLDLCLEAQRALEGLLNLNDQLILEEIAARWAAFPTLTKQEPSLSGRS